MKTIIHKANTRGHADHGWLKARHTFSFANYYDPSRVHFGALRVLNDDTIAPGMGFGTHPHDNMEIITIPLSGELEHRDSMGNTGVIHKNEVQVMSAGTGIQHSEYNKDQAQELSLFQIWIFPHTRNVSPRYGQMHFDPAERKNRLQLILSPKPEDKVLWIHQHAWFWLSDLEKEHQLTYDIQREGNGLYLMVIKGKLDVNGVMLEQRDGAGLSESDTYVIKSIEDCEFLLMEIPMK